MLIFTNPGLIEIDAVTTLGVSVKRPGSFGRFGTGMKFAVATVLRGGGTVTLWIGLEKYEFRTQSATIRDTEFQKVFLHNIDQTDNQSLSSYPLGITTMLGRDWEPWMVLRELGCNALDEAGQFGRLEDLDQVTLHDGVQVGAGPDLTCIVVEWDGLDEAYQHRGNLFLTGDPVATTSTLAVLDRPSQYLYYRGIRAFKLAEGSRFTYNLLSEQLLTEDRTLLGDYAAKDLIRDFWLAQTDSGLLQTALTSSGLESKLDFATSYSWQTKPTREFIQATAAIYNNDSKKSSLNLSARQVLLKNQRSAAEEESVEGKSYRRLVDDKFNYATGILADLGIEFSDQQKFIQVPELPNDQMLTMLEGGRVYYVPKLLTLSARAIAEELLLRWVDLNSKGYGMEDAARLLAPFVVGRSRDLKHDEQLVAEDEKAARDHLAAQLAEEAMAAEESAVAATDEEALDRLMVDQEQEVA